METDEAKKDLLLNENNTTAVAGTSAITGRWLKWVPLVMCIVVVIAVVIGHAIYAHHEPYHDGIARKRQEAKAKAAAIAEAARWGCKKVGIYPRTRGCPSLSECVRLRKGGNGTYYGAVVGWNFGALLDLHDIKKVEAVSYEELKWRFKSDVALVGQFVKAEDMVEKAVMKQDLMAYNRLRERLMHELSLDLLPVCCVSSAEMGRARKVLQEWEKSMQGLWLSVRFAGIQCWRERNNSVVVAVRADEVTGPVLRHFAMELYDLLVAHDVPMVVSRDLLTPFHMQILGLYSQTIPDIWQYLSYVATALQSLEGRIVLESDVHGPPSLGRVERIHGERFWG